MPDLVCFLAFGTVGDVLPLAHLAIELSNEGLKVYFGTNDHHQAR